MPIGIQRMRTKGWRMPAGAVSVTRPGRFSNPFRARIYGSASECVEAFDLCISEFPVPTERVCLWMDGGDFAHLIGLASGEFLNEIRGKDLACFCWLSRPCHRKPLLRRANPEMDLE
jgi:hypothetical protein